MGVLREFRQFLLRGNAIELAVGIVIGAAFSAVVNALVADIITPIIGAVFGEPDFGNLSFTINGSTFLYGDFLNKLISFLSVGTAVFFFVVKPMKLVQDRVTRPRNGVVAPEPVPPDLAVLGEIRDLLASRLPPGDAASGR